MVAVERPIRGYRLIMTHDLDTFNEQVNDQLFAGYQIMNGDGVRVEWIQGDPVFRVEMVRYVPEVNANPSLNERVVRERDRIVEVMTRTEEANDGPQPDPGRPEVARSVFWTTDSPDPFDDTEEDDDEVSDRQLDRLGAIQQEFNEQAESVVNVPESLRRAVREMRESGLINRRNESRNTTIRRIVDDEVDDIPF